MARGYITNGSVKEYPGKLTFRVVIICIIAAFGGVTFGYGIGISGGVSSMDRFLLKFFPNVYAKEHNINDSTNHYCNFNNQILTLFTSSMYVAALVASLGCSTISKLFGRRLTMLSGGILVFAGAAMDVFAQNMGMLVVGRLLLGFGIGCSNQSVPIYISEVAPYKYRGSLNALFSMGIAIGIFVANILSYVFANMKNGQGWRYSLGFPAVLAMMIIIGTIFLPDSPSSLIERGQNEEAKKELTKIRGIPDIDEEFKDLVATSQASKDIQNPYYLLKRQYRPHLTMAIAIPLFQRLTGINFILFYASVLFKTIGVGASVSLMLTMIIGGCNILATIVSIATIDKYGRRTIFLVGGVQMFIWLIVVAVVIACKFGVDGNPGVLPKLYVILVVGSICLYVMAFAWSWGSLGWLVPSEIFPLEVRSAAQSINVAVNMISTFVIAQFSTTMLCHMKFGLFILFAFFVVVMSLFIYKFLPETIGIPIEEMAVVWQNHSYWKKFVKPIENENIGEEQANIIL